jgi:hypothetical protein
MMSRDPRIVVQFRRFSDADPETPEQLCERVVQITGGTLVRPPSATGRAVFQVKSSSNLDDLIEEIRRLPSVEYAELDVTDRMAPDN